MYRTPRSLSPRKSNPDLLSITSDKPPAGLPLREALKQAQQHSHYSRATRMFQQEATIIPATAASVPAPTSICPTELEWQRTATIPILPTLETPQESQINIRTCKDTRKMVDDSSHALPQPWSMFHPPATAASSPSCSSECDSEDGDADGDSFASFFQSFPNESSVSTPTLISVEAPETARQGEDSHLPVEESVSVFPVKRKIKVKDEDSKDTSSSSTSSKKSTSKVSDPEKDWRYDLAESYATLQNLVNTHSKRVKRVDKDDESEDEDIAKSKIKIPRCTTLNQAITLIGDLLEENKALKANVLKPVSTTYAPEKNQESKTIKISSPIILDHRVAPHSIASSRPRLPLQCTTEDDIPVPASLPGLLDHSSMSAGHISTTTPAQIAKDLDDTVMQLCMPKGNLLPLRPDDKEINHAGSNQMGDHQTISLMALDSSPASARSAQSVKIPSIINVSNISTPSLPLSSLSLQQKSSVQAPNHTSLSDGQTMVDALTTDSVPKLTSSVSSDGNATKATVLQSCQESALTLYNSDVKQVSPTTEEWPSDRASHPSATSVFGSQQGFPFTFAPPAGDMPVNLAALESRYASTGLSSDKTASTGNQTTQSYNYTGNAISPGSGCQLSVLDTPRRKSLSHDTPDGTGQSGGCNADKIVHLPTLPSLKNFRIHTSTIRRRRQQKNWTVQGSSNPANLPAGNELTVSTGTTVPKGEDSKVAATPAPLVRAVAPVKVDSNIIGTMDFQPSASIRSSAHVAPQASQEQLGALNIPRNPVQFSAKSALHPLMMPSPVVEPIKTRSLATSPEDPYLLPQATAAAQDSSPLNKGTEYTEKVSIDQVKDQATTTPLHYAYVPSEHPPFREMQVPRHVQQQLYPGYNVPSVPTYPMAPYMPYYYHGYPYPSIAQALPQQQPHPQWYQPLPTHKRKASMAATGYNPITETHHSAPHHPFGHTALDENVMRQHSYGHMPRNQVNAAQSPYCLAWNPIPPMPVPIPGSALAMQQQLSISPPPLHTQSSPQSNGNISTGSRTLDTIPENEPLPKRSRFQ